MRTTRAGIAVIAFASAVSSAGAPLPLAGQSYLERTPHLDGGWVGLPGMLYMDDWALFRTTGSGSDVLLATPVYRALLALPQRVLLGGTLAANAGPEGRDVLEVFARWAGQPSLTGRSWGWGLTAGYSRPAGSVDGELAAWMTVGSFRLLAAARGFSDLDGRGTRGAAMTGVALPVAPGRVPVTLAGDLALVLGDGATTPLVWSVGLHAGIAATPFTVAFQASNARDPAFQGALVKGEEIHFGVAVMSPIPVGRLLGWVASREQAERSVRPLADPADAAAGPAPRRARVAVSQHAFAPQRIEITTGTVIEWVNEDDVGHDVTALDGSFAAGPLAPGNRWRARFDEAGTYLYYCALHPYMQGAVVVRH